MGWKEEINQIFQSVCNINPKNSFAVYVGQGRWGVYWGFEHTAENQKAQLQLDGLCDCHTARLKPSRALQGCFDPNSKGA